MSHSYLFWSSIWLILFNKAPLMSKMYNFNQESSKSDAILKLIFKIKGVISRRNCSPEMYYILHTLLDHHVPKHSIKEKTIYVWSLQTFWKQKKQRPYGCLIRRYMISNAEIQDRRMAVLLNKFSS